MKVKRREKKGVRVGDGKSERGMTGENGRGMAWWGERKTVVWEDSRKGR